MTEPVRHNKHSMCMRMQGYLRPAISGLDALISDVQQLQTDSLASTAACKLWLSVQWLGPHHVLCHIHGHCICLVKTLLSSTVSVHLRGTILEVCFCQEWIPLTFLPVLPETWLPSM